jgi:AmmeMemoRadiSam system protein B
MSHPLPRLRLDLDLMPSPLSDRPGLLMRDPFGYSDSTLIVPPALAACLDAFDGQHSAADLREFLVRLTGQLDTSPIVEHLTSTLSQAGFLEDETYFQLKSAAHAAFAQAPERLPHHAGAAYPGDPAALRAYLDDLFRHPDGTLPPLDTPPAGIAAPHLSFEGGSKSYVAAYSALPPEYHDRLFIILGTSHHGQPDRFGLTRKPYVTPYGAARTATDLVDRLAAAAPGSVVMEDYCHAIEHSIEFQVLFLQHRFGPGVHILPILCGAFADGFQNARKPEENEEVRRFLEALSTLVRSLPAPPVFVLGVDLAHMGPRYGDEWEAHALSGRMQEVEARDRRRLDTLCAGDASAFWDLVVENRDDLKWCGASPFYAFLHVVRPSGGILHQYQQWNIDEDSVVSCGALSFQHATA